MQSTSPRILSRRERWLSVAVATVTSASVLSGAVMLFADDVLYLGWKATGGGRKVENGVDTFIFKDGMIRVQTVVYTVQPA